MNDVHHVPAIGVIRGDAQLRRTPEDRLVWLWRGEALPAGGELCLYDGPSVATTDFAAPAGQGSAAVLVLAAAVAANGVQTEPLDDYTRNAISAIDASALIAQYRAPDGRSTAALRGGAAALRRPKRGGHH